MQIGSFASTAAKQIVAAEWRGISLSLFLLLTVTDALLALHMPQSGAPPGADTTSAYAVQAIGLFSISVALLRVAADSSRKRWATDSAFWLYLALYLIEMAIGAGALALGMDSLFAAALPILIVAPLAAWMAAAAVEQPLAWPAAPWFRGLGGWLGPLLVLLVPVALLAAAHLWLFNYLAQAAGTPSFWPLVLLDGLVFTLMVLGELALRLGAYRAVARA